MNREDVYKLIDGERAYQDTAWASNNPTSVQPLTIGEELLLLEVYVRDAIDQWKFEPRPEVKTAALIRKIGAIAVRAMETHGAPSR